MFHRALLRPFGLLALTCVLLWLSLLPTRAAPSAIDRSAFGFDMRSMPVAPGVEWASFMQFDERGQVRGNLLSVDLNVAQIKPRLLTPGPLAAARPLSQLSAQSGAVAAVNGDFFDMYHTNAPYGIAVSDGQLLKGPIWSWTRAAGVGQDGVGRLAEMTLGGLIRMPGGDAALAALNQHNIPAGGIGLYTTVWGDAPRGRAVEGASPVREVLVTNGIVTGMSDGPGAGWIAPDSLVLLGREDGATRLAALNIGDPVSVAYGPQTDAPAPFDMAISGNAVLLRDGQIPNLNDQKSDPRTAIGFSADGRRMLLVTVDGRQRESRGMTMRELAGLMQRLGADDALNLDGGGSTTMLARKPGDAGAQVVNQPSNGRERAVPNGIGIISAPGSGHLAGLRVLPAITEQANQVFPGLSRTLVAKGFDETYAPATAGALEWQSLTPANGSFEPGGVLRAGEPGTAFVQASAYGAEKKNGRKQSDAYPVQVLAWLTRITASAAGMTLNPGDPPGYFGVTGYSEEGQATGIETRDIALVYDQSVVAIRPIDQERYEVTPRVDHGSTYVTISVGGYTTVFPVFVGLSNLVVSEFEDLAPWSFAGTNAEGLVASGPGLSGQSLRLAYNFGQSTDPRLATAQAGPAIDLPGQVLRLGAWVKGEAQGEQLIFHMRAADGTFFDLSIPQISWADWQYVELDLPPGLAYPVQLTGISVREADPTRQYSGQVFLDGLGVKTVVP